MYFYSFITIQVELQRNLVTVPVTPFLTKQYWKESIKLVWSPYWQALFTTHFGPAKAEEKWESASGHLFSIYCATPKMGEFLQYVMLNKLKPYCDPGAPSSYFKTTTRGCAICHAFEDETTTINYHQLLKHILCTCPVVAQALTELGKPHVQGLANLGFTVKRIKEPDKPRIAYASWYFERGLREEGLDGSSHQMYKAFKAYVEYICNPTNPLIKFDTFCAKPFTNH